ncbi:MAG TPA: flagellar basal body-associated FliL family protein [Burkholderiaceae bacterium]
MSAAAAPTVNAGAAVPAKKGKKKLIIIAVAVLLVLLIAAGGAALVLKKRSAAQAAADADEAGTAVATESHAAKPDLKHPPTFLPLDPFVVNLADKDADRYAQVGITIEVVDAKFAEQMKLFMPAIRNGILMILAHKDSKELLERSGKELLAAEILRDASRTMGIEVAAPEPVAVKKADAEAGADDEVVPVKKAAKKKVDAEPNPIKHVHFSNFIVQ